MKSKGFTLIELMIVIAIIGIMFAVAAPAYLKWKNGDNANHGYDSNGVIVKQVAAPSYTCRDGVLVNSQGDPFVQNGQAVTCK
jgi:prepilin-type N-terminal cleavage/methylation domain-containing protein